MAVIRSASARAHMPSSVHSRTTRSTARTKKRAPVTYSSGSARAPVENSSLPNGACLSVSSGSGPVSA